MTYDVFPFKSNPRRRAVPQARVLTSEDFIQQIKVKEEKIVKELQAKEDRKRKKEEVEALKKSGGTLKKAKVELFSERIILLLKNGT